MQSPSPSPSPFVPTATAGDERRPDSPLVLYKPPTALSLLRTAAINLVLPFINGLMLGFGELFAHELAFRWGWGTQRVATASFGCRVSGFGFRASGAGPATNRGVA